MISKKECADYQRKIAILKGQFNGVEKMINDRRDVTDIVAQMSAIRAGLSGLAVDILKDESNDCFKIKSKKKQSEKFQKLIESFYKIT